MAIRLDGDGDRTAWNWKVNHGSGGKPDGQERTAYFGVDGMKVVDERRRQHELWTGTGSEDGLLKRFAMQHGFELDSFDPDEVLTSEQLMVNQSRGKSVGMQMGLADLVKYERVTAREAVRRTEIHHRLLPGHAGRISQIA